MENIIYYNHTNQFQKLKKILNTIGPCNISNDISLTEAKNICRIWEKNNNLNNLLNNLIENDYKYIRKNLICFEFIEYILYS